jgi:hypothetical protein
MPFPSYKRRRMGFTTIRTTIKDDKHQFDYSYHIENKKHPIKGVFFQNQ